MADAGSADGTCELAKTVPGVHVVVGDPSMWWAATTNLGCSHAIERLGARVLCLLNADCTWDRESFRESLHLFKQHSRDIVASTVLAKDTRAPMFYGGEKSWSGRLTMPMPVPALRQSVPRGGLVRGHGSVVCRGLVAGSGWLRESTFPHYYADSDFCFRAQRLGRRVWHCPGSVVLNDRHSTGLSIPKDDARFSNSLSH